MTFSDKLNSSTNAPSGDRGVLDGPPSRKAHLAVLVAALGYFVDIYDLILFSVVRVPSLRSLGVSETCEQAGSEIAQRICLAHGNLTQVGMHLINMQMFGMLIGGVLWGILGDKRGRLSVLFGSIFLYSIANIANAFVTSVESYSWLRLVAGIGLAGELGAGITLVTELLDARSRGAATTIIAGVGVCGAFVAVWVSKHFHWTTAYIVGGVLGLTLLVMRVGVLESGIFHKTRANAGIARGNFFALFATRERALRYVCIVLVGVPIWYTIGILVTLARELGSDFGMSPVPDPGYAVLSCYLGLAIGDFASGFLSQYTRSRRKAIGSFLVGNVAALILYFVWGRTSCDALYASIFLLGIANGYWAVFATVAAEQFGTNLRATAATTAPNFVRGSVPLLNLGLAALTPHIGRPAAAGTLGLLVMGIALTALRGIDETYGKDMEFHEA